MNLRFILGCLVIFALVYGIHRAIKVSQPKPNDKQILQQKMEEIKYEKFVRDWFY